MSRRRGLDSSVISWILLVSLLLINHLAASFSAGNLQPPPKNISISFTRRIKRARSLKDGIRVLQDIESEGYSPNVFHYSAVISKCSKEGELPEWRAALTLLKRMQNQGVAENVIPYNAAAISACGKAGRTNTAVGLLAEVKQQGLEPDVITYNAAISACEKGSRTDTALDLLAEMKQRGVEPNVITYSAVISACEKGSRTDTALELLAEMKG